MTEELVAKNSSDLAPCEPSRVEFKTPFRIAVLLPCCNEEKTVTSTISAFKMALPEACIYVYDNNSDDRTSERAREAGAIVCSEPRRGKGHVIRRMFADIDADIYVVADGDNTYHAPSVSYLVDKLVSDKLDMVVGSRAPTADPLAYRRGHRLGNRVLTAFVTWIFGRGFQDMLSGYRVFSRRFVKSFPALSSGFEIEVELSVHALHLAMPVAEFETPYSRRPDGSFSKLSTYYDGFRVLRMILVLFRAERPLLFFGMGAATLFLVSCVLAAPIFVEYSHTGLVPRFPTAILSAAIMILAFLNLVCGLILNTVSHGRREVKRLFYLQLDPLVQR